MKKAITPDINFAPEPKKRNVPAYKEMYLNQIYQNNELDDQILKMGNKFAIVINLLLASIMVIIWFVIKYVLLWI